MELQALLVLGGVLVVGVAVLLLMSLFSSSGTSYEDAIAQQRKAATELLALAENKNKTNKKSNKKAIKKQAKKEKKESAAVSTSSDHESEAPAESGMEDEAPTLKASSPHVDFNTPVVVDIPRDAPPNVKVRKRGKDPKVKPILVNKEDPSCVSDPTALAAPPILNHFEEIHPKDEFELLQSTLAAEKPQEKVEEPVEKKEVKAPKAPKAKGAAPKPAPPVEAVKEETRERRDSGDAPKEPRKAKKAEKKSEKLVEEAAEVVPPLNVPQPSELTTEKLLKQVLVEAPAVTAPAPAPVTTPSGGKKKKKPEPNVLALMAGDSSGVNVGELERVIRVAPLSDTEIQLLTEALLNKHHDPLPQHSEWTEGPNDPMQKLKKQLADKEKALADEIDASKALHAKLKEMRASLNAARHELSIERSAGEERHAAARAELHTLQARLTRLMEEHHALAQDKIILQQKLSAEGEVQAQRVQMEMHIQRLSETEAALLQQIAALQQECGAHAIEASAASESCIMAQQHVNEMAQQLQEANRACNELEQQRQIAVLGEQRAQQEARAAQDRLAAVENELQRVASRVQGAEASAEKIKEEAEKQRQQLASEVASLGEQLAAREAELAELKMLKAAPAQNGLPSQEQHKVAELAAVESVVESLREELSAAQRASRDQRDQLTLLNAQLKAYQDKNNELRTKNWKVMEALQSAEKALVGSKSQAIPAQDLREALSKAEEAQYAEVAGVLRAACPAAAPGAAAGRDWLHAFADNLKKELQKRDVEKQELQNRTPEKILVEKVVEKLVEAPAAARPDARLAELQAQNTQLQADLEKYRRAIDYTEEILSRLQQNVSSEEARWKLQIEEKQHELDQLRTTTINQLQIKIEALESQLTQAKATNHNHSFADAERLTEERLMADLSEKLSTDVCNGPSQVGLEDK